MKKRILSLLVLLLSAVILVGCTKTTKAGTTTTKKNDQSSNTEVKELVYADGTELKLAVGHNSADTTITFSAKIAGDGLTLADGKTYHTGDLKPVWAELQNKLKVTFNNVYTNKEAKNEYAEWKNLEFAGVDVVVGNASDMAADGKLGKIVDLSQWLDYMPNFKKFLEDNPIVYLSVVSDVKTGAIYYAPYFDGYDDIEKYFLMRIDWVEKLLDGEGAFTATTSDTVGDIIGSSFAYTPYMPTEGTIALESLSADGKSTQTITKNYGTTYGNIAKYMNEHLTAASTGVDAVNMLRNYIDAAYNNVYGTKRSQLFTGYNAAWDADELVALLRCVKLNTFALTGQNTNKVTGIFPREKELNRTSDLLSFTQLFGARGYESRNDYLYFDAQGNLVDARQDETLTAAVGKLNQLYKEGLILQNFDTDAVGTGNVFNKYFAQNNLGFMMYDYLQTQCIYNNDSTTTTKAPDYNFTAVMTPVAKYQDGTEGGVYMRFTESWRSVKTNGWCIPATCTGEKLQAALALFDYMYSEEGNVLMSFGPSQWHTGNTITYKGEQVPELNEACLNELWNKAGGNYTNYARQYLGSTLPIGFVKNQGMEYQCTTEKGKVGGEKVSVAIAKGIVKHVSPEVKENLFYTMVPTVLPTTKEQDTLLANYAALDKLYSKSKGKYNIYIEVIMSGFGSNKALNNTFITTMPADAAALVTEFKKNQGGAAYTLVKIQAWNSLLDFYKK